MSGALISVFANQRSFITVPAAPSIGTATQTGATTATVTYTAPTSDGGSPITLYTATSSPDGIIGTLATSGSGTITVSGLTTNTAYTFTVTATNAIGTSAPSAASNSVTPVEPYWISIFGTSGYNQTPYGITTNSSGDVYQCGFANIAGTTGTAETIKYNSSGVIQFQNSFRKSSDGGPTFYGVKVASDGSFYAGGNIQLPATANDAVMVKFDSSGGLIWQKGLVPSTYTQEFSSLQIAVDSSDNAYIAGGSNFNDRYDGYLIKWNSSGTLQYQKQFTGGGANSSHFNNGIAVTGNSVYLSGVGQGFSTGAVDATLIKYNQSSNSITWQTQLGSGNGEDFQTCVLDSSENIYVIGNTDNNSPVNNRFLIVKYNSSGTIQWQRKLGDSSICTGRNIAIDSSNNIYVIGSSLSPTVLQIAKYNSSGTIQWQRKISQTNSIIGRAIYILGNNMYITGNSNVTSGGQFLTVKLPTDGSKTGTYSVGGFSFVYAASSLTDEDAALTVRTPTFSVSNTSHTDTTLSYSNPASSIPNSLTAIT